MGARRHDSTNATRSAAAPRLAGTLRDRVLVDTPIRHAGPVVRSGEDTRAHDGVGSLTIEMSGQPDVAFENDEHQRDVQNCDE